MKISKNSFFFNSFTEIFQILKFKKKLELTKFKFNKNDKDEFYYLKTLRLKRDREIRNILNSK